MSDHEWVAAPVPSPNGEPPNGATRDAGDLRGLLEILRRRWWLLAITTLAAVGATLWSQRGELDQYTAEALLRVHDTSPPLPGGWGDDPKTEEFGSQVEIIRSRAVLSSVVEELGLQLGIVDRPALRTQVIHGVTVDPRPPGGSYTLVSTPDRVLLLQGEDTVAAVRPGEPIAAPGFRLVIGDPQAIREPLTFTVRNFDEALASFQRRVQVEQGKGADLLRILYTDPDPRFAARVVNAVADSYQRYRAQTARDAARLRRDVISAQLVQIADSLRSVQAELLDYQRNAEILDPRVESDALLTARNDIENEIRTLRFQQGLLESLVAGFRASGRNTANLQELVVLARDLIPAGPSLYDRIQELETERNRLTASPFGSRSADPRVQVVDSLLSATRNQMRVAASQALELVRARVRSAQTRLGELQTELGALPARTAEFTRLQQQVDAVQRVFDLLVDQYYDAQIAEGVETGGIQLVDRAAVPLRPDPKHDSLYLLAALLVGLVVGGVGAATIESLDNRIHHPRDAQRATMLRIIGTVPNLRSQWDATKSHLVGREAFRAIQTNLRFAWTRVPRVLAITSPAPGEGKSTVSANLALTLVEQGLRVLLIDADFRHPSIHRVFGLKRAPGLSNVLTGHASIEEAIKPSANFARLDVLPTGTSDVDPAVLVSSDAFAQLVDRLRGQYDAILIDTPPLLAVADSVAIAAIAEGTLVVARANRTESDALVDAVELLRQAKVPLAGLVLNAVPIHDTGYSRYYEYYMADRKLDRRRAMLVVKPTGPGRPVASS
jgi:tyrosine-protein kinase Etk/Wzc